MSKTPKRPRDTNQLGGGRPKGTEMHGGVLHAMSSSALSPCFIAAMRRIENLHDL
jgi:hypothetical protein